MPQNIHIIAEAGTNNNGNLEKSKKLAKIAANAGTDSVKFQMINTWGLYLPGKYEYGNYDIKDVIKIRQDGEMTDEEYTELSRYCTSIGIPFTASIFDSKSLELLASFKPQYIKLASCDLNNVRLLEEVSKYGIKVVLSTGMSSLEDIKIGVNALTKNGFNDLVILHCVSVYPAILRDTNLRFIEVLKDNFDFEIGFSDHTSTSHAACIALSLGATWFEKHFTEDKTQKGLDHAYAMDESELSAYVRDLHQANGALVLKNKKLSEAEILTRKRARRSLYAKESLPEGHVVQDEDVLIVRPENVMQAHEIDTLIGKTLKKPIGKHEPFSEDFLR